MQFHFEYNAFLFSILLVDLNCIKELSKYEGSNNSAEEVQAELSISWILAVESVDSYILVTFSSHKCSCCFYSGNLFALEIIISSV